MAQTRHALDIAAQLGSRVLKVLLGNAADRRTAVPLATHIENCVATLRAVRELGLTPPRPLHILVTSDEEVGSTTSRGHIEEAARAAAYVLVLDSPLPGGVLKTARKGEGEFWLGELAQPSAVLTLEQAMAQGRDRVIFSIGYGRTPHGRVLSNFGALGRPGGERLVAVAMTRARRTALRNRLLGFSSFAGMLLVWLAVTGSGLWEPLVAPTFLPSPVGSYPTVSALTRAGASQALAGMFSVAVVVTRLAAGRPHLLFRGATFCG